MGISMAILAVSDEALAGYRSNPTSLESLLNRSISSGSDQLCFLFDSWDGLHHLVATGLRLRLPMAALRRGDVKFGKALSDPTHAIHSATVKDWAERLGSLSEGTLRKRFDKLLRGRAIPRGVAGRMCAVYRASKDSSEADRSFAEMLGHFRTLRGFVEDAAQRTDALIFCRYED